MCIALADFFLKAVPVGGAHFKLNTKTAELLAIPIETRRAARAAPAGIEIKYKRLPALGIPSVRVTGLCKEIFGHVQGFALRLAIHPIIDQRIKAVLAFAVSENARSDWSLRRQAPAIGKY